MKTKTYLAFYIGKTRKNPSVRFWDKLICWVDKSPYSHVELAVHIRDDLFECYSSSIRDGGVRKKLIIIDNHWKLVPIECDLSRALQVFREFKGFKYDILGLGSTKWYWFPNIPNRVFCSELCACMLGIPDYSNYGVRRLFEWATRSK